MGKNNINAPKGSKEYKLMRVTEYAVTSLDDRAIQRLLRDVDNKDLALAMCGLGEEFRSRIFDNLSIRLATFIDEEMEDILAEGNSEACKMAEGAEVMLKTLLNLIRYGDIVFEEEEILMMLAEYLKINEENAN